MPRDLFGDVQQASVRVGSRSRYTVPLSLAAHALAVLAVIGATILGPVVLPGLASEEISYYLITIPPAPPPPAPPVSTKPATPPINPNLAPTEAPPDIRPEMPRQFELPDMSSSMAGVIPGVNSIETLVGEPPPPPPPPPRVEQKPVRPGAGIRPPVKVHDVAPIYSSAALAAHIQGTVIIEATIAADGRVQSARVLRSPPLLDEAALTAVRQWVYTPTLLNGVPVPVIMTVTVMFQLNSPR
ncbi:MAG TPA: TonB family protein [Vicinamibacterales bacterium]|nr:TonB family protein [Vicinamibacterales bacterium]